MLDLIQSQAIGQSFWITDHISELTIVGGDSALTGRVNVSIWQVMYPLAKPAPAYAKRYCHLRLKVSYSRESFKAG